MCRSMILLDDCVGFLPDGTLAFVDGVDVRSVDGNTRTLRLSYEPGEPMPPISCRTLRRGELLITQERALLTENIRQAVRVRVGDLDVTVLFDASHQVWHSKF